MQRTVGHLRLIAPIAVILISGAHHLRAASAYPSVPTSGSSARDFIPAGWHILSSASGDLNGDEQTDVAMVIESDVAMVENRGPSGTRVEPAKARILLVLFRQQGAPGLRLAARHDTFILRANEGVDFDPFEELRIDGGALVIPFYGGGWWRFNAAYTFRYRNDEFVLDAVDRTDYHASTGEFESRSVDFLSGRMKITTGNLFDDHDNDHVTWRRLPKRAVKTLRALKAPFNWKLDKDVSL